MTHNKEQITMIVNNLEWLRIVASKTGCCTLDKASVEAYLDAFKEITAELEELKTTTVQKMQEKLNEAFNHHSYNCRDCIKAKVDQVTKEMLGEL